MKQQDRQSPQTFSRRVFLPLAGLLGLLLVFAISGIVWIAEYQTRVAIAQQVRLATGALRIHAQKLAISASDYGYWDEAVNALVENRDYDWMKDNLGSGAAKSLGTDMAFAIDAQGRTVFSYINRTDSTADTVVPMPVDLRSSYDSWKAKPVGDSYSGLQPSAGTAVAIAIAPVRSSSQSEKPPTGYAIVFVHVVNRTVLTELARDFELANFRSVASDADISDSRALITLEDPTRPASPPARFAWDPQKPGNGLLKIALPFIGVFLFVLSVLAAMLFRHLTTSAEIITDREAQANHDALTGLANRNRFFSALDRAIDAIVPGSGGTTVMYIDLDGFKTINDTLGHSAGDALLVQAADRFQSCLRDTDLVARIGGDEFAIILSGSTERAVVQATATRILKSLAEPFALEAGTAMIGCSIGIATCLHRGTSSAALLDRADRALYHVKENSKNGLRFADADPSVAISRLAA